MPLHVRNFFSPQAWANSLLSIQLATLQLGEVGLVIIRHDDDWTGGSLYDNLDKSLVFETCPCCTSSIPDKPTLEIQLEEPAPFCSRVNSLNLLSWRPVWSASPTLRRKLEPNHPQASAAFQLRCKPVWFCSLLCRKWRQRGTRAACLLVYCGICASAFVGAYLTCQASADKLRLEDWHTLVCWQTLGQHSLTEILRAESQPCKGIF